MSGADRPVRRTPIHVEADRLRSSSNVYVVTVCTKARKNILASESAHLLLVDSWLQADEWLVGKYVILPDHVHLFCAPRNWESTSLVKWVKYWKSISAREWPVEDQKPIWQQQFWDTRIKPEKLVEKWEYVQANPVRHGLVVSPEDWPYRGDLNELW